MHYPKICPFIPIAPILKQCEIIAVTSNNHLKKNSVTESIELFSVRELQINVIVVYHFQMGGSTLAINIKRSIFAKIAIQAPTYFHTN